MYVQLKALCFGLCLALLSPQNAAAGAEATEKATDKAATKAVAQPLVGQSAPALSLKNQDQVTVSLADFRGKKNVILVFFPLAFTPV